MAAASGPHSSTLIVFALQFSPETKGTLRGNNEPPRELSEIDVPVSH
jgi:hypothetical protein